METIVSIIAKQFAKLGESKFTCSDIATREARIAAEALRGIKLNAAELKPARIPNFLEGFMK